MFWVMEAGLFSALMILYGQEFWSDITGGHDCVSGWMDAFRFDMVWDSG